MALTRFPTFSAAALAILLAAPQLAAAQAAAPAPAAAPVTPKGDLVDTMRGSGQFTTFIKGLDATNLTTVLKTNPNLTVFAPTDAAFAAMPPAELTALMANRAGLQRLLTHHVINARIGSDKIKGARGPAPSVANDKILLDGTGAALKADNATILQADVMASNGILHVVDHVLTPLSPEALAAAMAPEPASAAPGGSAH